MPVTKSAIKKLRQDVNRTKRNDSIRKNLADLIKKAKKTKTEKSVKEAISQLDKTVKANLMHKNKAARVKSSLSKIAKINPVKTTSTSTKKPVIKKPASKKTASKKSV